MKSGQEVGEHNRITCIEYTYQLHFCESFAPSSITISVVNDSKESNKDDSYNYHSWQQSWRQTSQSIRTFGGTHGKMVLWLPISKIVSEPKPSFHWGFVLGCPSDHCISLAGESAHNPHLITMGLVPTLTSYFLYFWSCFLPCVDYFIYQWLVFPLFMIVSLDFPYLSAVSMDTFIIIITQ